jgi:hypothetical protein
MVSLGDNSSTVPRTVVPSSSSGSASISSYRKRFIRRQELNQEKQPEERGNIGDNPLNYTFKITTAAIDNFADMEQFVPCFYLRIVW